MAFSVQQQQQQRSRCGSSTLLESLTEEELDAVTVVFHQYETGLREGTIYTKVTSHTSHVESCQLSLVQISPDTGL